MIPAILSQKLAKTIPSPTPWSPNNHGHLPGQYSSASGNKKCYYEGNPENQERDNPKNGNKDRHCTLRLAFYPALA